MTSVREVDLEIDGQRHRAHTVDAAGSVRGRVLLLTGIHGGTPDVLDTAAALAALEYDVVVLDWYCEAHRGQLHGPADIAAAVAALDQVRLADAVVRLSGAGARGVPTVLFGYCLGGAVALRAGCRADVAAVVVYYGLVDDTVPLDSLRAPVLAHYGTSDPWCTSDAVDRLAARLAGGAAAHEVFSYAGAGHAFAERDRPGFRAAAAADAWRRTVAFLDHHTSAW